MKRIIFFLFGIAMLALASCKKESEGSDLKAVFSYVADGYKVNFTNFSRNATTYEWEFGVGSGVKSTSKSPQHIFTGKGDYLVSLTATSGGETSTFIDTVSIIGPNIKIDGDLTDWEYVPYSHVNGDGYASSIRAVKTFAGSTDIFFLIEGTPAMNMEIIDLYIDSDNNPSTGFATWMYPAGSGADFLLEGPAVTPGWGSILSHTGLPTAFSWNNFSTFDAGMVFSAFKTSGGKKVIEFSLKKTALGSPRGPINFALIEMTGGWAEVGKIPESATPASKFINIPF